MEDNEIRHEVQKRRWFFASSDDGKPAHIVYDHHWTLCGSTFDTRAIRRAKHMCKRCRKIAESKFSKSLKTDGSGNWLLTNAEKSLY